MHACLVWKDITALLQKLQLAWFTVQSELTASLLSLVRVTQKDSLLTLLVTVVDLGSTNSALPELTIQIHISLPSCRLASCVPLENIVRPLV